MRLANEERAAIGGAIRLADAQAEIYLYGLSADDAARDRDIDLLVLSKRITLMAKIDILAQLHHQLGERMIDIAMYSEATRPLPRMGIREGILS
jgi:predicted nucleotidyltransferase